MSNSFHVSNGVRQGGVLSPVLFAVYLDGLLEELAGVIYLLEHSAMLMILFCWRHVPLVCE